MCMQCFCWKRYRSVVCASFLCHPGSGPKAGLSWSNLKGKKYAHLTSWTELVRHAGGAGLLFWENIPFMLQDILILRLF